MGFANLDNQQYMSLTTFRKSGEGVATPVWFAEENGKLYMLTLHNAGKVKRIRNNAQVTVSPCTVRGEVLGESADGVARILSGDEAMRANDRLTRKYGLFKRGFDLMHRLTGNLNKRLYLEISPR